MKKINIKALAQNHFKAPVTVRYPTNEVNEKGETIYASAKFIGLFRSLPVNEVKQQMAELKKLSDSGDTLGILDMQSAQIEKALIGFEALPGEELPFVDGNDQPLASTPETVAELLNSKEVRDAAHAAWTKARDTSELLEKN